MRFQTATRKTFRAIHRIPAGWLPGDPPGLGLLPLFQLPSLVGASRILVGEGEKVAEAVSKLPGLIATTSAHGPESPCLTDWAPLAGKEVVILPDHDENGIRYIKLVLEQTASLTPKPSVKLVPLEMIWRTNVPISEGYDVVDWLQCGVAKESTPAECSRELVNAAARSPVIAYETMAPDRTGVLPPDSDDLKGPVPTEPNTASSGTDALATDNGQWTTDKIAINDRQDQHNQRTTDN